MLSTGFQQKNVGFTGVCLVLLKTGPLLKTMLKTFELLTFSTIFPKIFLCLLKNVEIVIILNIRENAFMKQQVLKALANPARIFYVPYSLAVLNFAVLFLGFVIIFVIGTLMKRSVEPLWFLGAVILSHSILAFYSKREPQLAQIIVAKVRLFKQKIPRRLIS